MKLDAQMVVVTVMFLAIVAVISGLLTWAS